MIVLRLNGADLQRIRFAHSPLVEAAESLYTVHSGRISVPLQGWFDAAREAIRCWDSELLQAAVPPHGGVARLFHIGVSDATTSMDQQLEQLAQYPPEWLKRDLEQIWRGADLPPVAQRLIADGTAGPRRLAEAVGTYWAAAIEPHWAQIRAVLDADIAHRAARIAQHGISAMMSDLHPALSVGDNIFEIRSSANADHALSGAGMVLIPSVFVWPRIMFDADPIGSPTLTYGARASGTLWQTCPARTSDEGALAGLLGRSRARILERLALPRSTTDLAHELDQSAPTVSIHLSILRRCGLVTSWATGRRVLYQRTPRATSLMIASGDATARGYSDPA